VLARGKLDDPPRDVWVLDSAPAAILFECLDHYGWGRSLARLDGSGKLRWSLSYFDLGLGDPKRRRNGWGQWVFWDADWWVDEARGRAVLVALNGVVNLVDLETGKLTRGDARAILESLRSPSPLVRWRAFGTCPKVVAPEGWQAQARAALEDADRPGSTRLAAARALHHGGGARPTTELFLAAVRERAHYDEIVGYTEHAASLIGPDAVPVLEEYARRFRPPSPYYFARDVAACGDAGVPLLVRLVRGAHGLRGSSDAAYALANMGTERSRAALVDRVRAGDLRRLDFTRLPNFDDPALAAALAESLRTPGHGDMAIAQRLALHPRSTYAEPLAIALQRHEKGSPEHEAIAAALGACK
jgi:hypothetical protein